MTLCRTLPALALFALASCTSPHLPHSRLAKSRLAEGQRALIENEKLADHMAAVQSARVENSSLMTERFLLELQRHVNLHDWKQPLTIQGKRGAWQIEFDDRPIKAQGRPEFSPSLFDRLLPASAFRLEGYHRIASGHGAGAPVVLAFEDVERLRKERAFRPGNALYAPATVIFEFGRPKAEGFPVPVKCRVVNTFEHRRIRTGGKDLPLAWNVTAAVEANLGNHYILSNGLIGLLRPDKRARDVGLFGIESYSPTKIPVVFVHGLDSNPSIWKNAINEIYATPGLAARFQPLLFMYPTGLAVPTSAARLRLALRVYRDTWDPHRAAPGFAGTVLVGHSLGGLLSRLQVIDSGDDLWNAFFSKPVDEIPWLTAKERASMQAALRFNASPDVKRVVFIAVPHRGSSIADIGLVRLLVRLIKLPTEAAGYVTTALLEDRSLLNPALLKYHSLGLRSVDMLSPGHPYFTAIEKRPITVPFHSIIGDRGKEPGPRSSDGLVAYTSSHLEGAQSELLVPYGHSCTNKRETVAEILRILKLHTAR